MNEDLGLRGPGYWFCNLNCDPGTDFVFCLQSCGTVHEARLLRAHQFKGVPIASYDGSSKSTSVVRGNVNFIRSSLTPAHSVLLHNL
jgi:hypothetical protein